MQSGRGFMVVRYSWTLASIAGLCVALGACSGDDDRGMDTGDDPVSNTLRAGVVWGSCVPDDGIADFVEEAWGGELDQYDLASAIDCLATTGGGCAAIAACTGFEVANDGPCMASCDGDVFTACDDSWRFTIDCAEHGLSCDATEGCVDGPVVSCDTATFTSTCTDGRPSYCSGTVLRGPRCADHGLVCDFGPSGADHVCRGAQGTCTSSSWGALSIDREGTACDGDTLISCVNGGTDRLDCTSLGEGFGCRTVGEAFFCGLADECVPGDRTIRCEGTAVVVCNMGRLDRVDCTSLGFERCQEGGLGCAPTPFTP